MDRYITWDDLWNIIKPVEYDGADANLALLQIVNLFDKAHGSFDVRNNKLIFIERYDYSAYKYSSSIVGSDNDKFKVESKNKLLNKIHEEKDCIAWFLRRLNDSFDDHDEIYLLVFYERYILNFSQNSIKKRYNLHNNRYYRIMENVDYLAKFAFLLITPPQAMLDMLYND